MIGRFVYKPVLITTQHRKPTSVFGRRGKPFVFASSKLNPNLFSLSTLQASMATFASLTLMSVPARHAKMEPSALMAPILTLVNARKVRGAGSLG